MSCNSCQCSQQTQIDEMLFILWSSWLRQCAVWQGVAPFQNNIMPVFRAICSSWTLVHQSTRLPGCITQMATVCIFKSSNCDAVTNAVSYKPLSWYCLPDRFLFGVTTLLKIAWRHDPDCRATSWCNSCVGDVFEVLPTFMNLSTFCFNVIFTQ